MEQSIKTTDNAIGVILTIAMALGILVGLLLAASVPHGITSTATMEWAADSSWVKGW